MRIIESLSREETFELGREIGKNAKPCSVFALTGDLGTGKTVFTQGVAAGLGITEPVTSPTFTILQIYDGGRLPFFILTCTASKISGRWKRSDTTIVSIRAASA